MDSNISSVIAKKFKLLTCDKQREISIRSAKRALRIEGTKMPVWGTWANNYLSNKDRSEEQCKIACDIASLASVYVDSHGTYAALYAVWSVRSSYVDDIESYALESIEHAIEIGVHSLSIINRTIKYRDFKENFIWRLDKIESFFKSKICFLRGHKYVYGDEITGEPGWCSYCCRSDLNYDLDLNINEWLARKFNIHLYDFLSNYFHIEVKGWRW